ncbi:MAG: hypothetical protein K2K06_05420 [Oscillospiraceae bacterium]|nr:hypothetical protein [Oscillospiraceae bacterium]
MSSSELSSAYLLAKFLLKDKDTVYRNPVKAMELLKKSVEGGNAYAQELLNSMEQFQNQMLADTSFRLFIGLSKIIDEDYHQEQKRFPSHAESKLKNMIKRKKRTWHQDRTIAELLKIIEGIPGTIPDMS